MITFIEVLQKKRENFFLKTDHHGNSLGAFEEYKFILDKLDLGLSKSEIDNHLKDTVLDM